jgi:hypothetical protein
MACEAGKGTNSLATIPNRQDRARGQTQAQQQRQPMTQYNGNGGGGLERLNCRRVCVLEIKTFLCVSF